MTTRTEAIRRVTDAVRYHADRETLERIIRSGMEEIAPQERANFLREANNAIAAVRRELAQIPQVGVEPPSWARIPR